MSSTPQPSPGDDEPPVADARHLFQDAPRQPDARANPNTSPPQAAEGESYDLDGVEEPPSRPSPPPLPISPAPPRAKPPPAPEKRARAAIDPADAVNEVWTRFAEWGATIAVLAAVAVVLLLMLYAALSFGNFGLALFLLVVGGLTLVILSYPIVITLERPVRMTPEQAIRDYYAALSHHLPHYRRMWLLLSNAGRTSGSFGSFEGFKTYWKEQLDRLREGRAGKYTPLKFQVLDFRSEKSAGQTMIDAKFTLEITIRGRATEGPARLVRTGMSLVRGPDNMWYLDQGTLPDESVKKT